LRSFGGGEGDTECAVLLGATLSRGRLAGEELRGVVEVDLAIVESKKGIAILAHTTSN
jgi:hypothetical protein